MTEDELQQLLDKGFTIHEETKRTNTDANFRRNDPKPKQGGQDALVAKREAEEGMVDIAGKVVVRITRKAYRGDLDDDNLSGGSKQLRDAIASFLGRKGDSERDLLRFEYCSEQAEKGKNQTVIEFFKGW